MINYTAVVMNVRVEELTSTSVRVSWDRIDIMEITNYTVYYSATGNEQSVTVPSSQNSVVVDDLLSDVDYQFQVAAVALLYGDVRVMGQRSELPLRKSLSGIIIITQCMGLILTCYLDFVFTAETYRRDIAIAVVVSVLLALVLNNTILFTILCVCGKLGKKKYVLSH